jgi:hypothetical protein
MTMMPDREKIALKAACVQAAATMIAARDTGRNRFDAVRGGMRETSRVTLRQHSQNRLGAASVASIPDERLFPMRASSMQLELTDEETLALLNLLTKAIESDPFPLAPRVQQLRAILAKFGPIGPAPPPPARRPTPEETLARLACFVVADLTDPSSVPHELATTVPFLRTTPVVLLRETGATGYSMARDLEAYPWVLGVHQYATSQLLVGQLPDLVERAKALAVSLRGKSA